MSKKLFIGVSTAVLVASFAGLAIAKHHGDNAKDCPYAGKQGWHHGHHDKKWGHRGHHGKRWAKRFGENAIMKNADADKDGVITKEELEKAHQNKFTEFDKDKNGEVTKEEVLMKISSHLEKMAARITRRFDANQDGKVTEAEFKAAAARKLYMFDLNDDGKITKDEMPRGMKHRGMHKGHHRGSYGDDNVETKEKTPAEKSDQL